MKLCKHVLIANIDEEFVLMSAILMLFSNKRITKCQKVAQYQQNASQNTFMNDKNKNSRYYHVSYQCFYKTDTNCGMVLKLKSLALCTSGFQSVIYLLAIILVIWCTNNIFNADMAMTSCAVRV